MGDLINFYFNRGCQEFFGITRHGAIQTNNQQKYRSFFNKTTVKSTINF